MINTEMAAKNMKKITVFVVTYNRAKYLQKCIESILEQTYSEFDLVILNNASTDNTIDVVQKFRDERIQLITHEKNCGGIGNINFAIRHCKTQYIVIFHDDDIMMPRFLEREITLLEENKKVVAVSSQRYLINKDGTMDDVEEELESEEVIYYEGEDFFEKNLYLGKYLVFPTLMYRTSFLRENDIFLREQAGPCGDIILEYDLERYGGLIAELPERLIKYRYHDEQDSKVHASEMILQLFRYMKTDSYYAELLKLHEEGEKAYFRRLLKGLLLSAILEKISIKDAKRMMTEYSEVIKHGKGDILVIKILLVIVNLFPNKIKKLYYAYKGEGM